jgi:toxin ParE1/3/4
VRHLDLTEIACADLKSIRRYSQRTWGPDRTAQYMAALRDTIKGLLAGTVVSRNRNDLRPGLQMATSGRHCVLRPTSHASWSSVCSMTGWTTGVTSTLTPDLTPTGEGIQAGHLSSSTARNQGTRRFQLAKFRLNSSRSTSSR